MSAELQPFSLRGQRQEHYGEGKRWQYWRRPVKVSASDEGLRKTPATRLDPSVFHLRGGDYM